METKKAVHLTDYIVSTPPAQNSLLLILFIGLLFGIVTAAITRSGDFISAAGNGLFILVMPALLTTFTFKLVKRKIPLRQLLFLSAVCAFVYAIFYLAGLLLTISKIESAGGVVLVGFAIVFVIWFLIAKVVFNLHRSSFIFAIVQLFFNSLFLLAARYMTTMTADPLSLLFKLYLASFVFLLALYLLFWLINAPMKRSFGVSSIDAVTMFLSQWLYQSKDLEEAFSEVGQEAETIVGVLGFVGKNVRAFFVVPAVHFGPFGNLGGSEFSTLIAKHVAEKHRATPFVFHGTATHDLDPVSSSEIVKVNSAVSAAIDSLKHAPARGSILFGKSKSCRAICLSSNESTFIGMTRAPRTTEDINFAVGLALKNQAEKFVKHAIIADAHNSETGEIKYVESGDALVFEMDEAITDALSGNGKDGGSSEAAGARANLKLGVGSQPLSVQSVGKNGLQLALFEAGKRHLILVLLDSNGVQPAFRRDLLDSLKNYARQKGIDGAACEIFTTDTHQVNVVRGVLNPAGVKDEDAIVSAAKAAFDEALASLEPVKSAGKTVRFKIDVLGPGQSTEIVSTVNSVVAILKIAAPLILIGATIAILLGVAKL